jgi:hypothetical protein
MQQSSVWFRFGAMRHRQSDDRLGPATPVVYRMPSLLSPAYPCLGTDPAISAARSSVLGTACLATRLARDILALREDWHFHLAAGHQRAHLPAVAEAPVLSQRPAARSPRVSHCDLKPAVTTVSARVMMMWRPLHGSSVSLFPSDASVARSSSAGRRHYSHEVVVKGGCAGEEPPVVWRDRVAGLSQKECAGRVAVRVAVSRPPPTLGGGCPRGRGDRTARNLAKLDRG